MAEFETFMPKNATFMQKIVINIQNMVWYVKIRKYYNRMI